MSEAALILEDIRKDFEAWSRKSGIKSREAWLVWRAAILSDRELTLAELEPDAYQATMPKHWLRKEISALKKSIKNEGANHEQTGKGKS